VGEFDGMRGMRRRAVRKVRGEMWIMHNGLDEGWNESQERERRLRSKTVECFFFSGN
jgi:hypothetical protein